METFINIALVVLGTVGAMTAFGGDTLKKDEPSFWRRITVPGWISLVCLLLALGFGIAKESMDSAESAKLKSEREAAEKRSTEANTKLDSVEADLANTRKQLDQQTIDLSAARTQIFEQSKLLDSTGHTLSKQADVNLLDALSGTNNIKTAEVSIDLEPKPRAADLIDFVLGPTMRQYKDLLLVEMRFSPFMGAHSDVILRYGANGAVETIPGGTSEQPPQLEIPPLLSAPNSQWGYLVALAPQIDPNLNSAAIGYRDMESKKVVGSIEVLFGRKFTTATDAHAFAASHSELGRPIEWVSYGQQTTYDVYFSIPENVRMSVQRYWATNCRGSETVLLLDGASRMMILAKADWNLVTTDPSVSRNGGFTIQLKPKEAPRLQVGIAEF